MCECVFEHICLHVGVCVCGGMNVRMHSSLAAATFLVIACTTVWFVCLMCAGVTNALLKHSIAEYEEECTEKLTHIVDLVRGDLTNLQRITLGLCVCARVCVCQFL